MPTVIAKCYNPILEEFCKRLSIKSKPSMVILAAGMRKLLHIVFGVVKTQEPFAFIQKGV